jgi:hypothetical protein
MWSTTNTIISNYNALVEITTGEKMSFARSRENGVYVCHRSNTHAGYYRKGAVGRAQPYKDIWVVKSHGGVLEICNVGDIILPLSFLGKRVRLKIEIVEDEECKI